MSIRFTLLALALAVTALVTLGPGDARAHAGAGSATDYRITGLRVAPPLPARVRAVGGDDRLELRWGGEGELIVLGYAGEPYLRLTPDGAFENRRSPSVAANEERFGGPVKGASGGPPDWRRVADAPIVVWHDHRSHRMSRTPPSAVRADPGRARTVQGVRVPLRAAGQGAAGQAAAGQAAVVTGRLEWVPRPRTWWWVAGILLGSFALAVAAGRARPARAVLVARLSAALSVLCGAAIGLSDALSAPRTGFTAGTAPAIPPLVEAALWAAAVPAALLVWWVARRRDPAAEAAVMVGAAWLVGGVAMLGRLDALWHAVVPTSVPDGLARILVAVGLAGLVAPVVWAWRQAGAVRRRASPDAQPAEIDRATRSATSSPSGSRRT